MVLNLLLIGVIAIALYAIVRRHYLLGLCNISVGLYELSAPVFHEIGDFQDLIPLMWRYETYATDQNVHDHILLAALFLFFFNVAYVVFPFIFHQVFGGRLPSSGSLGTRPSQTTDLRHYYALIVLIFAFGAASFATDAGNLMLNDYLLESEGAGSGAVTAFFWYGTLLIVCCAPIISYLYFHKKWTFLVVILSAMSPLIYEVFLSSRRQFIAPALVFFLLQYLYGYHGKHKYLYVTTFLLVAASLLGAQASMRTEFSGDLTSSTTSFAVPFAAQFNEFVAAGTTTLSSIELIDSSAYTYFGHFFVLGFANSIPYIKLGNMGFPEYISNFQILYKSIAPIGGFSTIGEAYLAWGELGVITVALIIGSLTRVGHVALSRFFASTIELPIHGTYLTCITCILLLKYRSGFTDAYMATVNFTLLYYFVVTFQFLLFRDKQRKAFSPARESQFS